MESIARYTRGCGRLGIHDRQRSHFSCASYLVGQGTAADLSKAMENFEKGCRGAANCFEAAKFYHEGSYNVTDQVLAQQRLKQVCESGLKTAR